MRIVWDEAKRIANIDKHGLDFADILEFEWKMQRFSPPKKALAGNQGLKRLDRFATEQQL